MTNQPLPLIGYHFIHYFLVFLFMSHSFLNNLQIEGSLCTLISTTSDGPTGGRKGNELGNKFIGKFGVSLPFIGSISIHTGITSTIVGNENSREFFAAGGQTN